MLVFPKNAEKNASTIEKGLSWRIKRWANIRPEAPGNRSLHAFSQLAAASHTEIILLTVKFPLISSRRK